MNRIGRSITTRLAKSISTTRFVAKYTKPRFFSTTAATENQDAKKSSSLTTTSFEDQDDYHESDDIQSPVTIAIINILLLLGAGSIGLGIYLAYETITPNDFAKTAYSLVKDNEDVVSILGSVLKNESGPQLLKSYDYLEPNDGSRRVRVKFTLNGSKGQVVVFAEVSH